MVPCSLRVPVGESVGSGMSLDFCEMVRAPNATPCPSKKGRVPTCGRLIGSLGNRVGYPRWVFALDFPSFVRGFPSEKECKGRNRAAPFAGGCQRLIVEQQMPKHRKNADHNSGQKLRMHIIGGLFQFLRRKSPCEEKPKHALPQHQRQDGWEK